MEAAEASIFTGGGDVKLLRCGSGEGWGGVSWAGHVTDGGVLQVVGGGSLVATVGEGRRSWVGRVLEGDSLLRGSWRGEWRGKEGWEDRGG
jgi:hypothetical protein